ncbi:hypothetical protein SDC9_137701 [bioreactor metagenome]|uniref:Uncharacterized protein n=1 Tax=bioreactor metagenome TaxID=1076179 RepID=A0A645DMA8_9ZZZZ
MLYFKTQGFCRSNFVGNIGDSDVAVKSPVGMTFNYVAVIGNIGPCENGFPLFTEFMTDFNVEILKIQFISNSEKIAFIAKRA